MNYDSFEKYEEIKTKPSLSENVLKASSKKMNPKLLALSLKYGVVFISSIFLSLVICPQKGVGLFRDEHPFFHHILHQSEILCGLYCGLVFFLTTHLLTFFLLTHFERLKIIKSFSYLPVLFIGGFYGFSMTSIFSTSQMGVSYNLSWITVVGLSYFVLNHSYSNKLHKR